MADDWTFVRAAYGIAWFVLALYSVYLRRRRVSAQRRLESLES